MNPHIPTNEISIWWLSTKVVREVPLCIPVTNKKVKISPWSSISRLSNMYWLRIQPPQEETLHITWRLVNSPTRNKKHNSDSGKSWCQPITPLVVASSISLPRKKMVWIAYNHLLHNYWILKDFKDSLSPPPMMRKTGTGLCIHYSEKRNLACNNLNSGIGLCESM